MEYRVSVFALPAVLLILFCIGCADDGTGGEEGTIGSEDGGEIGAEFGGEGTEGSETIEGGDICVEDGDCLPGSPSPCLIAICEAGACTTVFASEDTACDDGDSCTVGEVCSGDGSCGGGAPSGEEGCGSVDACSGLNADDPCAPNDCCAAGGTCSQCDGGEDCPESGLVCVGEGSACENDNTCTSESCSCEEGEAICSYTNEAPGTPCDDNPNDCTVGDTCLAGECIVGNPLPLNDNNPCTKDFCVKGEITHEARLSGDCDDGNNCTTDDYCYLGTCVGGEVVQCENPPCASATVCVAGEGCVSDWMPEGAICDDGDACSVGETCDGLGICDGGEEQTCNDGNPCTLDICNPDTGGCTPEPLDVACNDGDSCTVADFCIQGACQGQPLDCSYLDGVCSIGVCLNATCLIQEPNIACDDGDASTCNDMCYEGECAGIDCTTCSFDGQICDDSDACTLNDVCGAGICQGTPLDCSSLSDACKVGYCSAGACEIQTLEGSCNDGNFNTCNDLCVDGECIGDPCTPELQGGETCASAVDMGDGGEMTFNLCDYQANDEFGWCGNVGPDFYVRLKAQKNQGSLKMEMLQGFPSLIVNYRFFTLSMCEKEDDWFCYYNAPATPGWSGYDPEADLYLSFGSTDGTCGVVSFSVSVK